MATTKGYKEIWEQLSPMMQKGGDSFIGQAMNAGTGLKELSYLKEQGDFDSNAIAGVEGQLKAQQGQAIAGGAIGAVSGIADILKTSFNAAQIGDTSEYQNQIDEINSIGRQNYNSFDELSSDFSRLGQSGLQVNSEKVRGMGTGEKIGSVFSTTMSGLTTGLTVGGPWGAAAGAVIGLGSGLAGVFIGDAKARTEEARLNTEAAVAQNTAQHNLNAATENLTNRQWRANIANRADKGGSIQRKSSVQRYAERVLKKPVRRELRSTTGFTRTYGQGGTTIRLRVNE